MTPTETLARFSSGLKFEDLPPPVVVAARRHILDTLGVALLGVTQPMPQRGLAGLLGILGSAGEVTVWGTNQRMAAPYAALANGISSHVLDFDDTHTAGIVHGSAILVPVVFALSEEGDLDGKALLTAFVAGWEIAARVGLAAAGTMHKRGYHTSSVAGVFGAAAAASKLLGLTEQQTLNAIALAGSQASGINEYQTDGTSSKILHTGWAAHAGIVAAHLARSGMTGPKTIFEGRLGFLNAYGDLSKSDPTRLTSGLGSVWEMTQISIKPYSCCHFGHAFIDCAARLKRQGIQASQVAKIECIVPEIQVQMVCEPVAIKLRPTSPYGAKFSLPYMVAVGLIDGRVDRHTFTEEAIKRPDLLDLASRVTYRIAAPGETTFPEYFPGWIRATTIDGKVHEERMDRNWGTPGNPMADSDIAAKFVDNLTSLGLDAQPTDIVASLNKLERQSSRQVARMLVRSMR